MKKSHRVAHEKSEAWWVLLLSVYNFYCGCQDSFSKKEYKLPLIPFFVILSFIIFDLFHTTPFSSIISYFAIAGSNPYTSRIERSLDFMIFLYCRNKNPRIAEVRFHKIIGLYLRHLQILFAKTAGFLPGFLEFLILILIKDD